MSPDLCSEQEVAALVHRFYEKARADALLGPMFEAHVENWDHHLVKMTDFWSSLLRGTARYQGTPMVAHATLPQLRAELFQRWLQLFRETTSELGNAAMQSRADEMSQRIARSLWYGYQMHNSPDAIAAPLEVAGAPHNDGRAAQR